MKKYSSIGAIGWRNHAAAVIKIVNASGCANVKSVYHPSYIPDVIGGTSKFSDLLNMDGVMILSPNDTHMSYLEKLTNEGYKGYIFCEKPPVTDVLELKKLRQLAPARVMYDFSLRHGRMMAQLQRMLPKIGTVIAANVYVTHGLAYKSSYPSSWRADVARHRHGVLETVSVHWIDLLLALLGKAIGVTHHQRNIAKTGTSADTSVIELRHESGAQSTIISSYAAPAFLRMSILGSDGLIELDDHMLTLRHPRDTFDAMGNFAKPSIVEVHEIDDPFDDGIRVAVSDFVTSIHAAREFPRAWMEHSIETMDVIIECKSLSL